MKVSRLTPVLNVSDVPASIAWFEKLGWRRGFTYNDSGTIDGAADANASGPASFGAVFTGECEIFLCKDGQGSRGGPLPKHAGDDDTGGVWMTWWVETPAEVDAAHALALSYAMTIAWPPTDEPWGVREFHLCHPDGHTFRERAALTRAAGPPRTPPT